MICQTNYMKIIKLKIIKYFFLLLVFLILHFFLTNIKTTDLYSYSNNICTTINGTGNFEKKLFVSSILNFFIDNYLILLCITLSLVAYKFIYNLLKRTDHIEKKYWEHKKSSERQFQKINDTIRDYRKIVEHDIDEIKKQITSITTENFNGDSKHLNLGRNEHFEESEHENDRLYNSKEFSPITEVRNFVKDNMSEINKEKNTNDLAVEYNIYYFEEPEPDGYFIKNYATESEDSRSLYKVIVTKQNPNEGELHFLENQEMFQRIINAPNEYLKPACDYSEQSNMKVTRIVEDEKGSVLLENDKWIIESKVKIIFS